MYFTTTQVLALGGPGVTVLFAVCFLLLWRYSRQESRYLLFLSAAFLVFALAAASQILLLPRDIGHNTLVSGFLYLSSTLLFVRGMLGRYQARFDGLLYGAAMVGVLCALAFYYYVQRDIVIRIYVLNFGIGGMLLLAAFRLSQRRRATPVDRALYWIYLSFTASFFLRTLLTNNHTVTGGLQAYRDSSFWLFLQLTLLLFAVVLALALLTAAMLDIITALQHERNVDGLTKLYNRRSFEERSERALDAGRSAPTCLMLCDIDHFKAINDTHGHAAGDRVLIEVGRIIDQCARAHDIAGRFGGEEFIVLLPNTSLDGATYFAERVRKTLADTSFKVSGGLITVTGSFGVAERLPGEPLLELINRTDAMLYAAKQGGRNRVVLNGQDAGLKRFLQQTDGLDQSTT